jgi:hypothetical protein
MVSVHILPGEIPVFPGFSSFSLGFPYIFPSLVPFGIHPTSGHSQGRAQLLRQGEAKEAPTVQQGQQIGQPGIGL